MKYVKIVKIKIKNKYIKIGNSNLDINEYKGIKF